MKLISVNKWLRNHVVREESAGVYLFYCDRKANKKICKEDNREDLGINTCLRCVTLYYNAARCVSREADSEVGSIVQVPRGISETGKIKIVADQSHCDPNTLQCGVSDWEYKAIMFDPDSPNEQPSWFDVTKKELDSWKELY